MRNPASVLRLFGWFVLLLLAACGNGGEVAVGGVGTGSDVYVVLDTANGSDVLLTVEVAAVSLERRDGQVTANLLAQPTTLTLTDPSGEAAGLELDGVPAGDYTKLHLLLTSGTGRGLFADGTVRDVFVPFDLVVPVTETLRQGASPSWLLVAHDRTNPLVADLGSWIWNGELRGRADGAEVGLVELVPVVVGASQLRVAVPAAGDGRLEVTFANDSTFGDDQGNVYGTSSEFLAGLSSAFDLELRGTLSRDGRLQVRQARRGRGNDGPRLIGRIVELIPASRTFALRVQAENRRGRRRLLANGTEVLVRTAQSRIQRPNGAALSFADLQNGELAKVEWTSVTKVPGERDVYTARQIDVTGTPVALVPEWQGVVQFADAATRILVMVPLPGETFTVLGIPQNLVLLVVTDETLIERRTSTGDLVPIGFGDIAPGLDRVVLRGEAASPSTVVATSLRVQRE
jgi:hypothetical protein